MAIEEATRTGPLQGLVEIACVIVSRPDAGGIKKALERKLICEVVRRKDFQDGIQFGRALISSFEKYEVTAIGQHGWLPTTPLNVINLFPERTNNQHPGATDPGYPDFGGTGMHGARVPCATLYFMRKAKIPHPWIEATAHVVDPVVDRGLIIHSERVAILPDDTVASLQERLLPVEHKVQIEAWRQIATGTAKPHLRPEELIKRDYLEILNEAKRAAEILYPKG